MEDLLGNRCIPNPDSFPLTIGSKPCYVLPTSPPLYVVDNGILFDTMAKEAVGGGSIHGKLQQIAVWFQLGLLVVCSDGRVVLPDDNDFVYPIGKPPNFEYLNICNGVRCVLERRSRRLTRQQCEAVARRRNKRQKQHQNNQAHQEQMTKKGSPSSLPPTVSFFGESNPHYMPDAPPQVGGYPTYVLHTDPPCYLIDNGHLFEAMDYVSGSVGAGDISDKLAQVTTWHATGCLATISDNGSIVLPGQAEFVMSSVAKRNPLFASIVATVERSASWRKGHQLYLANMRKVRMRVVEEGGGLVDMIKTGNTSKGIVDNDTYLWIGMYQPKSVRKFSFFRALSGMMVAKSSSKGSSISYLDEARVAFINSCSGKAVYTTNHMSSKSSMHVSGSFMDARDSNKYACIPDGSLEQIVFNFTWNPSQLVFEKYVSTPDFFDTGLPLLHSKLKPNRALYLPASSSIFGEICRHYHSHLKIAFHIRFVTASQFLEECHLVSATVSMSGDGEDSSPLKNSFVCDQLSTYSLSWESAHKTADCHGCTQILAHYPCAAGREPITKDVGVLAPDADCGRVVYLALVKNPKLSTDRLVQTSVLEENEFLKSVSNGANTWDCRFCTYKVHNDLFKKDMCPVCRSNPPRWATKSVDFCSPLDSFDPPEEQDEYCQSPKECGPAPKKERACRKNLNPKSGKTDDHIARRLKTSNADYFKTELVVLDSPPTADSPHETVLFVPKDISNVTAASLSTKFDLGNLPQMRTHFDFMYTVCKNVCQLALFWSLHVIYHGVVGPNAADHLEIKSGLKRYQLTNDADWLYNDKEPYCPVVYNTNEVAGVKADSNFGRYLVKLGYPGVVDDPGFFDMDFVSQFQHVYTTGLRGPLGPELVELITMTKGDTREVKSVHFGVNVRDNIWKRTGAAGVALPGMFKATEVATAPFRVWLATLHVLIGAMTLERAGLAGTSRAEQCSYGLVDPIVLKRWHEFMFLDPDSVEYDVKIMKLCDACSIVIGPANFHLDRLNSKNYLRDNISLGLLMVEELRDYITDPASVARMNHFKFPIGPCCITTLFYTRAINDSQAKKILDLSSMSCPLVRKMNELVNDQAEFQDSFDTNRLTIKDCNQKLLDDLLRSKVYPKNTDYSGAVSLAKEGMDRMVFLGCIAYPYFLLVDQFAGLFRQRHVYNFLAFVGRETTGTELLAEILERCRLPQNQSRVKAVLRDPVLSSFFNFLCVVAIEVKKEKNRGATGWATSTNNRWQGSSCLLYYGEPTKNSDIVDKCSAFVAFVSKQIRRINSADRNEQYNGRWMLHDSDYREKHGTAADFPIGVFANGDVSLASIGGVLLIQTAAMIGAVPVHGNLDYAYCDIASKTGFADFYRHVVYPTIPPAPEANAHQLQAEVNDRCAEAVSLLQDTLRVDMSVMDQIGCRHMRRYSASMAGGKPKDSRRKDVFVWHTGRCGDSDGPPTMASMPCRRWHNKKGETVAQGFIGGRYMDLRKIIGLAPQNVRGSDLVYLHDEMVQKGGLLAFRKQMVGSGAF